MPVVTSFDIDDFESPDALLKNVIQILRDKIGLIEEILEFDENSDLGTVLVELKVLHDIFATFHNSYLGLHDQHASGRLSDEKFGASVFLMLEPAAKYMIEEKERLDKLVKNQPSG